MMKPYVDIAGAGELTTKITNPPGVMPTLTGASDAELRYLTVQNTKTGYPVYDVYNDGASPSLLHVTAICSAPQSFTYAIDNTNGSSPTMTDVTASASTLCNYCITCGFCNSNSSPIMLKLHPSDSGGYLDISFTTTY